jgi:putative two-component system response regulator
MHIHRISELSKWLATISGISAEQCEVIRFASTLHDVGKIGIPDQILLKPGKLDESEFHIMKQHSLIGGKILSDSERFPVLHAAGIIALQHHEKWDGTGYPTGLNGEDIHIFARIVSIVDVFDALSSERPYKKAFPLDKTVRIMEQGRGIFFDPVLLDLFLDNMLEFVAIRDSLKDEQDEQVHLCDIDKLT